MEVIFNRCWVLEIQNEVSTNQSGQITNHIGECGRMVLTLQRHYGQAGGQTAKWKLVFTKFDCMKGDPAGTCPLTLCMSNNLGVQFDVPLFIGGTATRRAHARIACRESRHLLCSLNMLVRKDFGTTKWTPKLKNIQTRLISCIHINRRKKTVKNAVSQFRT